MLAKYRFAIPQEWASLISTLDAFSAFFKARNLYGLNMVGADALGYATPDVLSQAFEGVFSAEERAELEAFFTKRDELDLKMTAHARRLRDDMRVAAMFVLNKWAANVGQDWYLISDKAGGTIRCQVTGFEYVRVEADNVLWGSLRYTKNGSCFDTLPFRFERGSLTVDSSPDLY